MIKQLLSYNKEDSLIRDSFILFIATMFANLAAFFYHFYMGRVLGPADYGVLGAVLSLIYIINVPFNVIQTTIAKFTADFRARKKEKDIDAMCRISLSRFFLFGVIFTLLFLIVSPFIAGFLKINVLTLVIFSPIIVFALLLPTVRGIVQGRQFFKKLGLNIFIEAISKLFFGILFVIIGFHIYGAIAGIVVSFIVAFFWLYPRRHYRGVIDKKRFDMSGVYKFGLPVFFALLALTLCYTIDVFLIKHYFSEVDAGYYAAISLIGKIVFFASLAISTVMFPKVADLYARGKNSMHLLKKSMLFVFLIGIAITIAYAVAPRLVVLVLLGSAYLSISGSLWVFATAMLFFSFTYLLVLYSLSIGKRSFLIILFLFLVIEGIVIWFYHPSLQAVIWELVLLNLLSFVSMLVYTWRKCSGAVNNSTRL